MSVFHVLYLEDEKGIVSDLKHLAQKILVQLPGSKYSEDLENNIFKIINAYFCITIRKNEQSISFRSEDYNMHFTHKIWFDIYLSEHDWPAELMKLAGYLLGIFTGDFVLESNGDKAYLMRNKEDGLVYAEESYVGEFPFELLGIKIHKSKLKQV